MRPCPTDDTPPAEAALFYAGLGWQVVVLHDLAAGYCSCGKDCGNSAGKHPRLSRWQDHATDDAETVRGLWRQYPHANVGARLGSASGFVGVDIDPPNGEEFLAVLADGDLPTTWEMATGKGRRLLYAVPDVLEREPRTVCVQDEGGHEALRLQGGATGAQCVLPPSRHPSGNLYRWLPGRGPTEIPLAPMPGWLVAEMCRPAEPEAADPPRPPDPAEPWADFNRRESWDAWLSHWGYRPAGGRPGVKHWTRPGKSGGTSVTVGHVRAKDGTDALYVFSGNCPRLPAGKSYDLFGAFYRVEHGGDASAAARWLLDRGYGERRKPGGDSIEQRVRRLEGLVSRLWNERQAARQANGTAAGVRDG